MGTISISFYVMSDIHGEANLFHGMLQQIQFSDSGRLYILGDVAERGPDGIALLQEIMNAPNITMLLGNHEYMMLQYYSPKATEADVRCWNKNGNSPAVVAFEKLNPKEQAEILSFLRLLPTHFTYFVFRYNHTTFYMVHGFPGSSVHDEVRHRPALEPANPIPEMKLIV